MPSTRTILPFHFVDVFAVEPLTGNPLAVVVGGADLPFERFQAIAREFNQSETTFIVPPTLPGADWQLRSFTPGGVEVAGAGHNALGAWWWLAAAGQLTLTGAETSFHQQLGDRVLPLTVRHTNGEPTAIVMAQEAPTFARVLDDPAAVQALAAALGVTVEDLALDRLPAQVVSTGAGHLLVPVRDREVVDRLQPDSKALFAVLHAIGGEGCYVFSLDARQPDAVAYARFFNPTVGIAEDPATGTAAGPLAAQLVRHGLAPRHQSLTIEQGTAIGRTSLIALEVTSDIVTISGAGVIVASGQLFV